MADIFCSHPTARKPHSSWIYTVRTPKTPSQWAIRSIRLWKTQFLRGFRRNPCRQETLISANFIKAFIFNNL